LTGRSAIELLLAFKGGDESAFVEITERYPQRIANFIWKMVHDRHAAEDLAQEAFVRVYTSIGRYQPKASFAGYLFRIANNLALNHIRSQRYRRAQSLSSDNEGAPRDVADGRAKRPEDLIDNSERAQAVREAIDRLPAQQRSAILLKCFGNLSYQEVASSLSTSLPAVKSLLFRARANLKDILSGLLDFENE
jgi:RNA polymerase sigma-70 factor (ECF subfamily)